MTAYGRQVLTEEARAKGVPAPHVLAGRRWKEAVAVRVAACHRLLAEGMHYSRIGRELGLNHSTVMQHLGRLKRQKKQEETNADHEPGRTDGK